MRLQPRGGYLISALQVPATFFLRLPPGFSQGLEFPLKVRKNDRICGREIELFCRCSDNQTLAVGETHGTVYKIDRVALATARNI